MPAILNRPHCIGYWPTMLFSNQNDKANLFQNYCISIYNQFTEPHQSSMAGDLLLFHSI